MKISGKTFLGVAGIALSIMVTSCEGLGGLGINFDSEYVVVEFVVPPTTDTGFYSFPSEPVTTKIDSLLQEQGMTEDDILSVKIKDIIIEIQEGAENFNTFSYINASLLYNSDEKMFAYQDTIPQDVSSLECKYIKDDLSAYVLVPEFQLVAGGQLIAPVEKTMVIKGKVKFNIRTSYSSAMKANQ